LYARQVCEIALKELDGSRWDYSFYVLDCGEGFLFATGCEVDAFWVVLRELEDGLLSETDIAYAEESLTKRSGLEGVRSSRHTTSDEDHLSIKVWDIFVWVERYPAGDGAIKHCVSSRSCFSLTDIKFNARSAYCHINCLQGGRRRLWSGIVVELLNWSRAARLVKFSEAFTSDSVSS
jgi:hypothetical protein